MNSAIEVNKLSMRIDGRELYDQLSFRVPKNHITTILGVNGSGKSTLLNILSGISNSDAGTARLCPHSQFAYIFQNYRASLLPWRSVRDNITLPLQLKGISSRGKAQKLSELLSEWPIDFSLDTFPYRLSGGQQQLIILLRSLIAEPDILLADEPFSALDYERTLLLRERLFNWLKKRSASALIVSHSIEEAVQLADTLLIFSKSPTQIISRIEAPLHSPRSVELLSTEAFHTLHTMARDSYLRAAA